MKRFGLVLILPIIGLNLSITACSNDSKTKKVVPDTGYSKASCAFTAQEGQDYSGTLSTYNSLNTSQNSGIVVTHFNKELDQKKFLPVLSASIESIKLFIERNTDLELFGAPSDIGRCKPLSILSPMYKAEHLDYWAEVNKDSNDKSFIAGVYRNSKGANPFTIIREDANKYTLIHEYMHYVFDNHRIKNGNKKYADDSYDDLMNAIDGYNSICRSSCTDSKDQSDLVKQYKILTQSLIDYLTTYTLEEITIESLLISEINKKTMTQTSAEDVAGAYWYIEASAKKAIERLDMYIKPMTSKINDINNLSYYSQAQNSVNELISLKKEIQTYLTSAQLNSAKLQKTYGIQPSEVSHKSCSHNHDHKLPELL